MDLDHVAESTLLIDFFSQADDFTGCRLTSFGSTVFDENLEKIAETMDELSILLLLDTDFFWLHPLP